MRSYNNTTDIETHDAVHLPRLERPIVVNTLHVSFLHCPNEEIYPSNERLVTASKCIDPNATVILFSLAMETKEGSN
jgi:hypothetical protein